MALITLGIGMVPAAIQAEPAPPQQPASGAVATPDPFSRDQTVFDGALAVAEYKRREGREPLNFKSAPQSPDVTISKATASGLGFGYLSGDTFRVNGAWPAGEVLVENDVVIYVESNASGEISYYHDLRNTAVVGANQALRIQSTAAVSLGDIKIVGPGDVRSVNYGAILEAGLPNFDGWSSLWIEGFGGDPLVMNELTGGEVFAHTYIKAGETYGGARIYEYGKRGSYIKAGDVVWRAPKPSGNPDYAYEALVDNPSVDPTYGTDNAEWRAIGETPHLDLVAMVDVAEGLPASQQPRFEHFHFEYPNLTGRADRTCGWNNVIRRMMGTAHGAVRFIHGVAKSGPNNWLSADPAGEPLHFENVRIVLDDGATDLSLNWSQPDGAPSRLGPTTGVFRDGVQIGESEIDAQGFIRRAAPGELVAPPLGADIPLSGTTDAQDGATIEARVVDAATGTEVHGWQGIASASEGTWSGSYPAVPANAEWLRMQVRVNNSSGAVQEQTTRFGVGLVILVEDQSNTERELLTDFDGGLTPETIGNAPGDFQYIMPTGRQQWDGTTDLLSVDDTNPRTVALAAMARAFHVAAPGLKVVAGFVTQSGVYITEMLEDGWVGGNGQTREWDIGVTNPEGTGVVDKITADGSDVSFWHIPRFQGGSGIPTVDLNELFGVLTGTDTSGNLIAGVDQTRGFASLTGPWQGSINHVLAEATPGLLTGRTKYIGVAMQNVGPWEFTSVEQGGRLGSLDTYGAIGEGLPYVRERVADFEPFHFGIMQPGNTQWGVDVHFAGDNPRGMPEWFRYMAHGWLSGAGVIAPRSPLFDRAWWEPNGNYVLVWSSSGPVTTKARIDDGAGAANFPEDPTASTTPGASEVLGFVHDDLTNAVAEIVDWDGTPAAAGYIKILPPSGESFNSGSGIYYHASDPGGVQWPGGNADIRDWNGEVIAYNDNDIARATYNGHMWTDHLPVVQDASLSSAYGGTNVQPPLDPEWINSQNDIVASGGGLTPIVDGSNDPDNYPFAMSQGQYAKVTWELRFNPTTSGGAIFGIQQNYDALTGIAYFGGSNDHIDMAIAAAGPEKFADIYGGGDNGDPAIMGNDTRLLIEYDGSVPEIRVYRDLNGDGTYTLRNTVAVTKTSTFMNDAAWFPPQHIWGGSPNPYEGTVNWFRLWTNPSTQNGAPPADQVTRGLEIEGGTLVVRNTPYARP